MCWPFASAAHWVVCFAARVVRVSFFYGACLFFSETRLTARDPAMDAFLALGRDASVAQIQEKIKSMSAETRESLLPLASEFAALPDEEVAKGIEPLPGVPLPARARARARAKARARARARARVRVRVGVRVREGWGLGLPGHRSRRGRSRRP